MRGRALVVLALAGPVLLACAAETGTPRPAPAGPGPAGSASTTTTPSSPARPREIALDGRDPCALIRAEQLAVLGFDRAGRSGTDDLTGAPTCTWIVNGGAVQVIPVTGEGVEAWSQGRRLGRPSPIPPVRGFPAITVTLPERPLNCDVVVDTADGQYLSATSTVLPGFEERFPAPCEGARALAEVLVENLLS
ncbi:DUF3558 domain-containing protein [Actinosynnema mirum]|uniref:DUF3558 domain-containing protein n=1 Tax=Actinosynnema mirum (strain ATCC 29888 / DSM 43827 / JCM 3225 / NBRC 14064 / NCIMB 13271 / NRRL B-12336 / IMRU 3971 / 101) TaxID=446462 RepID=C6WLG9_ACTMD|nr:DUF3558 domain-containing protein [Actinosynnema mirum]ACU38362.1 hypothetical protein Amir_4518 [Actinosynnema mirum DSM 43827]